MEMRIKVSELKKLLVEAAYESPGSDAESAMDAAVDMWIKETQGRYESEDPSMAALGPESWNKQVEAAAQELRQRFAEAITGVEDMLTGGEFHTGNAHRDDGY